MRSNPKKICQAQVAGCLLHKKLCAKVSGMDVKAWFSSMARRRVTVAEIGEILGVSRNTATTRVDNPTADDIITISRHLGFSPIHGLVELGFITYEEAFDFLDGDGQLLSTASTDQLIYRLAEDGLSPAQKLNLGAFLRKSPSPTPRLAPVSDAPDSIHDEDDGTVRDFDWTIPHAADSSPDEDAIRYERGEDPID